MRQRQAREHRLVEVGERDVTRNKPGRPRRPRKRTAELNAGGRAPEG